MNYLRKIAGAAKLLMNQKILLLTVCFPIFFTSSFAQQKVLSYIIVNKNDSIGNMQAIQKTSGDDIIYTMSSTVVTRMLMTIRVSINEEAHYHKDKLIWSLSGRVVNDKPKGKRQTKAVAEGYLLINEKKESRLNQKTIGYDFPKLYFKEPVAISQVYSDYYQKMLVIKTLNNHVYQIDLPEGGSNIYYYENGVCRKVDIHGTLFSAQMILQQ